MLFIVAFMPPFSPRMPLSKPRKSVPEPLAYLKSENEEMSFQLPPTDSSAVFSAGMSFVVMVMNPPV